jgi:hypothetical protein
MAHNNTLLLLCDTRFGERWEMRAQLEFVRSPYLKHFSGSLVFGHNLRNRWYSLVLYHDEEEAVLGHGYGAWKDQGQRNRATVPTQANNDLRICFWDGRVDAYVNGRLVYYDEQLSETHAVENGFLGVADPYGNEGGEIVFRDLHIRRLAERPRAESNR